MTFDSVPGFVDLKPTGDECLALDFHRRVLVPNFRPEELVEESDLIDGLKAGTCRVTVAQTVNGDLLGGAVGDWFSDSRVQLLSYLAVDPRSRGRGLGATVLNEVLARWTDELDPLMIIGEVEDPRYHHDERYGDPAARIRFYERLGARSLPVPYCQPALRPGAPRVPHLLLMVFAAASTAKTSSGHVDGVIVERFLSQYFASSEGCIRPEDVELEATLAACRTPGGLPLLLVEELPEPG